MKKTTTPGPWRVSSKSPTSIIADEAHIASLSQFQSDSVVADYGGALVCESVSSENLALIAAAPDLLAACAAALHYLRTNEIPELSAPLIQTLQAAVEKAHGACWSCYPHETHPTLGCEYCDCVIHEGTST